MEWRHFKLLEYWEVNFDEMFSYISFYHAWSTEIIKIFERHADLIRSAILFLEIGLDLKNLRKKAYSA